ncbi:MAG: hypothetical protein M3396_03795 [Actinomycetota bacterium]|nr:hypothetical protein [Actinomycetota bacterium]
MTAASSAATKFATYRVFATQYQPIIPGSVEVAVPDKCVKFAARRDSTNLSRFGCSSGYRLDLDYRVKVTRASGQSSVLPVNEVGPWNVDDNYWNPSGGDSPRPRRRFTDLPLGMPEAQAAFSNDYNARPCNNLDGTASGRIDGADQFSRCVLNPGGLDLSVAAAAQLGLGHLQNEWVTVAFLWEPVPNWEYQGGALTSGPDAASRDPGLLDVFARGTDNAMWQRAWDGSTWRPWGSLGGVLTSDPAAVSWGPNRLDVFARGTDNQLWHRAWDGSRWLPWEPLGGHLTSGADVASWGEGRLDVFARGTDNAMWHRAWDGSRWRPWESLGGVLTSDPAAVSWGPNRLDVFARGTDNQLWHRAWDGSRWLPWEPLGGHLTSGPDVASWGEGRLDVFARGTDSAMWHRAWDASTWRPWESLGGVLTSDPAAVSWGPNRLDVFARGTDNALYHRWWVPTGWAP